MKTALVLIAWLCLTTIAAALTPERQQSQPIAYVAPSVGQVAGVSSMSPRDLARSFPPWPPRAEDVRSLLVAVARSAPTTTTATVPRPVPRRTYAAPSGSCAEWVAAAGITDTASAFQLIARESGCRPYAVNPTSGACGVGQALPCSKTGCAQSDGACQTAWMNSYVLARYGTWSAALAFQIRNGWY